MKELALSFDTSNYTTSCAVYDGETGTNAGRLLDVPAGQLGLRQSEALFSHVKRLPSMMAELKPSGRIIAVGASSKPRETEDSYMPCFLAGSSQGAVLAHAMDVPFFEFSHQQGHIAAAAWSADRIDLLDKPHLAWHLSGGTTELLYVQPRGTAVVCEIIGGTTDVSAGQLIDRAGQLLGLAFPSGRELDRLAQEPGDELFYEPKLNGLDFSLSGVEHKLKSMAQNGANQRDIACFAVLSVVSAVLRVTENAVVKYGDLPVLFTGGVASNSMLRQKVTNGIFAEPRYSTDNALGVAILTYRAVKAYG
jgi:N6-L-threonylcarbamoyladenine synthase